MSRSTLSRSLEPLAASLWGIFIGWTLLLAVVWVGALDPNHATQGIANEGLRQTVSVLIQSAVPAWLALAVANIHLALSRSNGLRSARLWLWILLGGTFAFAVLASVVPVPFGRLRFITTVTPGALLKSSGALGPNLLGVPVGWALLWFVLVAGARECVLWAAPRISHARAALAGAAVVVLSIVNLEPLAHGGNWQWWFWYRGEFTVPASPQWAAYAVVALLLSWVMRDTRLANLAQRRSRKPAIVFLVFNVLLVAAHLRLWLWPPVLPDAQMPL